MLIVVRRSEMYSRLILAILSVLWGGGCSTLAESNHEVPSYVSVAAPKHYDVWVEHLRFERSGEYAWHQAPGGVSCCWSGANGPIGPGGRLEPFPNYIAIQWFSFSEQKFYQRLLSIPQEWEAKMQETAPHHTHLKGVIEKRRNRLTLGLAPGGEIVVWVMSQIGNEVEIARLQANEIEGDVSRYGNRLADYHQHHGDYLKANGIPTEGW